MFLRRLSTAAVLTLLLLACQRINQRQTNPIRIQLTQPVITGANFLA